MRLSRLNPQTFDRRKFLKLAGGAMGGAVALGSGLTFVRAQRAEAPVSLKPISREPRDAKRPNWTA